MNRPDSPGRSTTSRRKRRPRLPPLEPIPAIWTDEQAVAVYDFCAILQELIWRKYRSALAHAQVNTQMQASSQTCIDNRTWPLPFHDEHHPF